MAVTVLETSDATYSPFVAFSFGVNNELHIEPIFSVSRSISSDNSSLRRRMSSSVVYEDGVENFSCCIIFFSFSLTHE